MTLSRAKVPPGGPLVIFLLLLTIPGVLYTLASFYNTIYPAASMAKAIGIAVFFAAVEYVFKVPIIAYGHQNGISNPVIQVCWVGMTVSLAWMTTWFVQKPLRGH